MIEKNIFPYIVNICYIINGRNEVLLQKKARGFGKGKWNGPGGKIKDCESIEDSVIREILEETSINIAKPEKVAELEFIFTKDPNNNNYCHVFVARKYNGEPINTGEGRLQWFPIDQIPLDKMWDDDKYWLPRVLSGEKLNMRFYFDKDGKVENYLELKNIKL